MQISELLVLLVLVYFRCIVQNITVKYLQLAEVPSVAWVLNGLSVESVYTILLLYPLEIPVPSLPFHNLLMGSLLIPLAF